MIVFLGLYPSFWSMDKQVVLLEDLIDVFGRELGHLLRKRKICWRSQELLISL